MWVSDLASVRTGALLSPSVNQAVERRVDAVPRWNVIMIRWPDCPTS